MGLIGGRGSKRGENASVLTGESFDIRRRLEEQPLLYSWSTATPGGKAQAFSVTAGQVLANFLPQLPGKLPVYAIGCSCYWTTAASTLTVGIYRYNRADGKAYLMPQTTCTITPDEDDEAFHIATLPSLTVLQPGEVYMVGSYVTLGASATLVLRGEAYGQPNYKVNDSATLPISVDLLHSSTATGTLPIRYQPSTPAPVFYLLTERAAAAAYAGSDSGTTSSSSSAAGNIAYFDGTDNVIGDNNLNWDATGQELTVTGDISVSGMHWTGFADRTLSTLTWTDAGPDRTLSIQPTGTSFEYWCAGIRYVTTGDTVQVTDVEGVHAIYYDGATLTAAANPTQAEMNTIILTKTLVSIVYWDTSASTAIYVGEERHNKNMDPGTHSYLHFLTGCAWRNGLALNTISADGAGATADAQFGVDSGAVADEDIYHEISAIASTTGLPIYYMLGASADWQKHTEAGFSVRTFDGTSATRLAWNEYTGGAWQLTEASSGNYVLCHIYATTEKDNPIVAIMGQGEYSTKPAARNAAITEIKTLTLNYLLFPELRPLGTVIFQTNTSYASAVNARIASTEEGDDYVDLRSEVIERVALSTTDHGSLTGMADDDHSQYFLLAGRASGQTGYGGTAASENLTFGSTAHATKGSVIFGSWLYFDEANSKLGLGAAPASGSLHIQTTAPGINFTDTDTNADCHINCASSAGTMYVGADINNEVANSSWQVAVDGTTILTCLTNDAAVPKVGIGTTAVPHGAVGHAMLAFDGADTSDDGPHVQFTTAADDYPLTLLQNWAHDNINIVFDAYWNPGDTWKSSNGTSNFRIHKQGSLNFDYEEGVAAGSSVTWGRGIVLDKDGDVCIGGTASAAKFEVVGSSDRVQVIIKANATQSSANPLIQLQDSAGTVLMDISSKGTNNAFFGKGCGAAITTGYDNLFMGTDAGTACQDGYYNVCFGSGSGTALVDGYHNTFIGYNSGKSCVSGVANFGLGSQALEDCTASNNLAIGRTAMTNLIGGTENVSIGTQSFSIGTGFTKCTGLGWQVGTYNASGSHCTLVGWQAGLGVSGNSNSYNVFVGSRSGRGVTTGGFNSAFGYNSLLSVTTGGSNCVFGAVAGDAITNGANNCFFGYAAGGACIGGGNNSCFGYQAGDVITTGTYNICIGRGADPPSGAAATYELNIGDTIYGNLSTKKIGINIASADGTLHVHEGSAGAVTANSYSTLVLETGQDWNYLSFLSPDAKEQGILFGDASDNAMGGVKYDHSTNALGLYTNATGAFSAALRVTIDENGKVGVGTPSPDGMFHIFTSDSTATAHADADELILEGGGGNCGMSIMTTGGGVGRIAFGDPGDNMDGVIAYDQTNREMVFNAASSNQLTVASGKVRTHAELEIDGNLNHDGSNIGFFGTGPVAKAAALTASLTYITHTGPGAADYAIATPVDSGVGSAWGFSNQNEFETVMSVILNLQTRVNQLESRLQAYGLLT